MTDNIYEYKDDKNWFIGKWGGFGRLAGLGDASQESLFELSMRLRGLVDPGHFVTEDKPPQGYDVTVVKLASEFLLIRFLVDMIVAETGRDLAVTQQAGAILVTEGDRLVLVHLPEGGVPLAAFFGRGLSDVGDKILIATKNEGKTAEFRQLFAQLGLEVDNLNNHPDLPDVAETGLTFEENARLKAETIAELTGSLVLADDSGLKVDILGGLPGVWSARFSGPDATDEANNRKLLHELATAYDKDKRSAQFHCTLVVAAPGRESLVVSADWPGYIAYEPQGDQGFGYDPLFLVGETNQTAAQLLPEEKNAISHRGLAVKKLLEVLPEWLATP